MLHTNSILLRRATRSFAIVHGYFLIQMISISSKNKMHRQVFVVVVGVSEDHNPDSTYYKIH